MSDYFHTGRLSVLFEQCKTSLLGTHLFILSGAFVALSAFLLSNPRRLLP